MIRSFISPPRVSALRRSQSSNYACATFISSCRLFLRGASPYSRKYGLLSTEQYAPHSYAAHSTSNARFHKRRLAQLASITKNKMQMRIVNKQPLCTEPLTQASGESISSQWRSNEKAMEGQTKREP